MVQSEPATWLGVQITQIGALLILPVSLALRLAMPHATGWHHVWATALLTIVATFLVAILLANQALR
jgi:ABC-type antimicrobial peptide transport system permease subunit